MVSPRWTPGPSKWHSAQRLLKGDERGGIDLFIPCMQYTHVDTTSLYDQSCCRWCGSGGCRCSPIVRMEDQVTGKERRRLREMSVAESPVSPRHSLSASRHHHPTTRHQLTFLPGTPPSCFSSALIPPFPFLLCFYSRHYWRASPTNCSNWTPAAPCLAFVGTHPARLEIVSVHIGCRNLLALSVLSRGPIRSLPIHLAPVSPSTPYSRLLLTRLEHTLLDRSDHSHHRRSIASLSTSTRSRRLV